MILPVILLVIWQLLPYIIEVREQTPIPSSIIESFWEFVIKGDIFLAASISLVRVILGFLCAAAIAIPLGMLMGSSKPIERRVAPLVESFRPIAPIALLPIAILWFGSGTPAAIFLIAWASFFPLLLNTIAGVREVDSNLVKAGQTMGVSKLAIFMNIIFPAALPRIIIGTRIALGTAWTAVIAAELASTAKAGDGASGGIGQMMFVFYAFNVEMNSIVVTMITVGLVGFLIDIGIRYLSKKLIVWRSI